MVMMVMADSSKLGFFGSFIKLAEMMVRLVPILLWDAHYRTFKCSVTIPGSVSTSPIEMPPLIASPWNKALLSVLHLHGGLRTSSLTCILPCLIPHRALKRYILSLDSQGEESQGSSFPPSLRSIPPGLGGLSCSHRISSHFLSRFLPSSLLGNA